MKNYSNKLMGLILIASSCLVAQQANADISNDWWKKHQQRHQTLQSCLERWEKANYTHPDNEFTRWKWIVTSIQATRVTPDRCENNNSRRIGIEQKTTCINEALFVNGIVSESEMSELAKRKGRDMNKFTYECLTLLLFEGSDLVEYRKSRHFGIQRQVVGVPML